MSEWQACTLSDVLKFGNGKSRPKAFGKIPVYGGNGILDYTNCSNYSEETIVIGRVGAYCGATYYENQDIWVSDNALSAKALYGNDTKFLYYLLKNLDLNQFAQGSSHPLLTQTLLNSIEVGIPSSLPEQKAIASVLSSLDDKIDLLNRQNKTLEAMAETLFRQWFIEEAIEDWEKVTLGEVVNITSSKRIFYSEYVNEGIPFYRSKEIIELNKSGQTSSELFISNERFDEIESKFGAPREGDILLTSVGTLGVTYQVKATDKFYFKDGNLTWFKDFKRISSNIIFCWLNSKDGKEQLDNISIGSTQAALTIQGLKSLELHLPSSEVIQKLDKQLPLIYQKVNPQLSEDKCVEALKQITNIQSPDLLSNNQTFHKMLTEGISLEIQKNGNNQGEFAWLIDFENPTNNEFLVINQVTIREGRRERRPDLILYINGLPLVVIELKNATDENATIDGAYKQIQTYQQQIPSLFTYNAFNIVSDGL